jgi:hypothetical protein
MTPWIPPKNFTEFYTRYPNFVRRWVKRTMRWSGNKRINYRTVYTEIVEDYTQELLLHLAHPAQGCIDHIKLYDPSEVSAGGFCRYIKVLLHNKFHTIRTKEHVDALPHAKEGLEALQLMVSPNANPNSNLITLFSYRFLIRNRPWLGPYFTAILRGETVADPQRGEIIRVIRTYWAGLPQPKIYRTKI